MSLNDSLFGEESLRWREYEKVLMEQVLKPVQRKPKLNIIKLPTKQGDNMASGEFAEPIYKLIDECGQETVLQDLIKWMSGEELECFVDYFKRNHDIQDEMETNDFVMCMSCQATHHEDEDHVCDDQETHYFSSKIPAC